MDSGGIPVSSGTCLITDADLDRLLALMPEVVRQVELVKTVCLAVVDRRDAPSAAVVLMDWAALEKLKSVGVEGARLNVGMAAPYRENLP